MAKEIQAKVEMLAHKAQKSILLIKLGALGDLFNAFGTFERLRMHHHAAHITLMTTKPFEKIVRQCPYFDNIKVIEKPLFFELHRWLKIRQYFAQQQFDFVYDLQRNDRTKFMRLLAPAITRKQWLGGPKGGGLGRIQDFNVPAGMLDTRDMGAFPVQDLNWLTGKTPSEYNIPKNYVLIIPGCAPQHLGKRWPVHAYAGLAGLLQKSGYTPVLIGTADEKDVTSEIKKIVPQALDLTGRTRIEDIASLAKSAAAAIGNDTGPMHIASTAGCPVVSLFSYLSNPEQSAPRGKAVKILRAQDMADISVDMAFGSFNEVKRTV